MTPPHRGPRASIAETRRIAALFDRVAPRYDLLNKLMSLGQDKRWRGRLVRTLGPALLGRVLDVGCGTGDVTLALSEAGARAVGLDPSREMLRLARAKAPQVDWVQADALRLPFKEACFTGASSAFVLRNLPDRKAAFREQARVLLPRGIAAHMDLVRPSRGAARALHGAFVRGVVPMLGLLSSDREAYRYLARTIMVVPQPESFAAELSEAGFVEPRVERMAMGGVAIAAAQKP